jgi:outer membrane biosynthesis protein TonB
MSKKERKIYFYATLLAILIHLLLFNLLFFIELFKILFLSLFPNSTLFAETQTEPEPDGPPPIVLEFDKPEPMLQEKFYELRENPNANENVPEDADILSAESSISAAPDKTLAEISDIPKWEEQLQEPRNQEESQPQKVRDLSGDENLYAFQNKRVFSKSALGKSEESQKEIKKKEEGTESKFLQEEFNAQQIGEFALSSYEWEWAPYMLDFLDKLRRVWTVPPAYSKLGLIYGQTIVYFKMDRVGRLVDMRVLEHKGHHSLETSSSNAIQSCFPFKPLPVGFDEEFLEIKILMIYPNLREPLPPEYRN